MEWFVEVTVPVTKSQTVTADTAEEALSLVQNGGDFDLEEDNWDAPSVEWTVEEAI